jgi:spore maturation protein CgeB
MKIAIFGLGVTSSWGNGHATLWRGLCAALGRRGHRIDFFEKDVPYYAAHRDLHELPGGRLHLYPDWETVLPQARRELSDADVGMVTSYCPDGIAASELVSSSPVPLRTFYDLDAPVTLSRLAAGERVEYMGERGLRDFDLVLSYTGGRALAALRDQLGAPRVAPLYGSVDPAVHRPAAARERYAADLSYLGTWSPDRDAALRSLFVDAAQRQPSRRFVIGGAMYDAGFPWQSNIYFVRHLPPAEHPAFYCSSRLTLNVTRRPMAEMGFCPSARLFEASACGVPVLSDAWEGLDQFFEPGREILVAGSTRDTEQALARDDLARVAWAARERVLACHTADIRAGELERILESTDVGYHTGRRQGQPHSAAGVL